MLPSPPLAPGVLILGNGLDLLRDALSAFVKGYQQLGHGRSRMATVRALAELEALTLGIEGFRSLLSESERTSRQIAAVISERLAADPGSTAHVSTATPLPVQPNPADRLED